MKFLLQIRYKFILLFSILMSDLPFCYGQDQTNRSSFWSHVQYGGGIGLSFGDGFFSGTLAPNAIYNFNEDFGLGIGLNGSYNSQRNVFNSTILGASIIGIYNPITELQVSSEFEQLNVNRNFENNLGVDDNYWVPAFFVGLGYRSNNVIFGVRYDLLYDERKSVYVDPWSPFVRVFF